ncbi:MAG TPA: hypothetical protein VMR81_02340 [Patescibacteria group bacterium]|nr:hypothetical protein [Patescibacteria group bacterium]
MQLPNFDGFPQRIDSVFSQIKAHKILIIVVLVTTLSLGAFGVFAMRLRGQLLSQMKTNGNAPSNDIYYASGSAHPFEAIETVPPSQSGLLGASSNFGAGDSGDNTLYLTPTPFPPLPTYTPAPTIAPIYTTTTSTSSPASCVGIPTAYNSEAIVSTNTALVNTTATITVELLDCNNNNAPVNDTLTVTLTNTDSGAKVNGATAPVTVTAQNGKATIPVFSSNTGIDTYIITDTSRSFTVTDPHNHNPSITFANNTSGNGNCTTGVGIANSWYSDIYPTSPVTTTVGSTVTFTVYIRDCNKNAISTDDSIRVSVSSGDAGTQINGSTPPYDTTAQSGQTSFTVVSQVAGTVALTVQDTTSSFAVTDANNYNPSVVFGSASTPAPTPAGTDTPTPTAGATPSPTPTTTPTANPTTTATPSATPT